ncbi:AT-rich interactive domain-containing protein 5A [Trichomycterus rosablanca]|uniref:AT-rich interactive domain-containing protein 5A n=1 Tax=Trichomycterus rosablanca TaxID=2290929 RepID=UPI002F358428
MVSDPRGEVNGEEEPIEVCEERTEKRNSPNQSNILMESSELINSGTEEFQTEQSESEEKNFVMNLHRFMKDRGTPIERIPHLGFKQINLWKIYKAVELLGGYDSVTARRLWKNVYDELGGSPGSTSAATCTRRHYERLVLPFERHCRGEADKPLPPSKPRKPYKRSEESKNKSDSKKKRRATDRDDQEEDLRANHHCEHGVCPHSGPWPRPLEYPDGDQVSSADTCLREKPLIQPLIPTLGISPLEKKKRTAQASLSVSLPAGLEEVAEPERPSVIQLSHSSTPSGRISHASEGSPLPLSSPPSSRSPSPFSVSSDDCVAMPEKKTPASEAEKQKPASFGTAPSPKSGSGVRVCQPLPIGHFASPKDLSFLARPHYNLLHLTSTHPDKTQRHSGLRISMPATLGSTCWVPSASSFTRVIPRAYDPYHRPVSLQPPYKPHAPQPKRPNSAEIYAKKTPSSLYFPDRKDKSKMVLPKPMTTQQFLIHQPTGLPMPYLLPSFERPRESVEQMKTLPLHPVLLPSHLSIPQSSTHPTHPLPMGATLPGPYQPALHPYPYSVPIWHPPPGYSMATLQPF